MSSRINVVEDGELVGWFDPDTALRFEEHTWFDGHNHVGSITGSQYDHQVLYRTEGKRWVRYCWSQWQGSPESYDYLTDAAAREWLLRNHQDEAVAQFFGPIDAESGPDTLDAVSVGGAALRKAFPILRDDFTDEWFDKAAWVVLRAAGIGTLRDETDGPRLRSVVTLHLPEGDDNAE